jgi:hypothetical protein
MSIEPSPAADPPGGHAAERLREQLERDLGEVPDGVLPDLPDATQSTDRSDDMEPDDCAEPQDVSENRHLPQS